MPCSASAGPGEDETLADDFHVFSERGVRGRWRSGSPCRPGISFRSPASLSFAEAACLPTAYLTAYRMLFTRAGLRPGQSVLVQGAGGGVATAAILLGRAAGLAVYVTSRSEEKRARALELGAVAAIEPGGRLPDRVDAVHRDRRQGDVGPLTQVAADRAGRWSSRARRRGPDPSADLARIFWRQLSVVGSSMGTLGELHRLCAFLEQTGVQPARRLRARPRRRPRCVRAARGGRRVREDRCRPVASTAIGALRLGFVGLGNLGRHLAASLLAGGVPADRARPRRGGRATAPRGGRRLGRLPAEVAAASDSVFTCLPSPAAVADVLTGESGVLAGLARGRDLDRHEHERSPRARSASRRSPQARGRPLLEAPVTGGVHLAASGEITVLVGGDADVFAAHLPAFEAIGGRVFHIGPLGSASVIKVITNMLAFIHLVAAGEALMLARRAGLDLAQSFEVIKASSGTSFVHETESQVILNGSYDIGFTMDLACKDLGFAHELGDELGVPLELAIARRADVRSRARGVRRLGLVADGGEAARGRARHRSPRARVSGADLA